MIDLHCHILPGIDDGAQTVDDSIALLESQYKQGVRNIIFTPHFHIRSISIDKFIEVREKSYEKLCSDPRFGKYDIKFKKGCEIYFSNKLMDKDVEPLCFEGTSYLLIELSTRERPYGLRTTLLDFINRGLTPVLAHVERYPYFERHPEQLCELVEAGCVAQVNADAVLDGKGSIAFKYLKWGIARVVCSDCHSVDERPSNLRAAYDFIDKKLGSEYVRIINSTGMAIFDDRYVDIPVVHHPKKVLGFWV